MLLLKGREGKWKGIIAKIEVSVERAQRFGAFMGRLCIWRRRTDKVLETWCTVTRFTKQTVMCTSRMTTSFTKRNSVCADELCLSAEDHKNFMDPLMSSGWPYRCTGIYPGCLKWPVWQVWCVCMRKRVCLFYIYVLWGCHYQLFLIIYYSGNNFVCKCH